MVHRLSAVAALVAVLSMAVGPAFAETTEVRLALQPSLAYLSVMVMQKMHLVEKQTAAAGLPGVKATYSQFGGGNVMNDAVLSGNLDFAASGPEPFFILWGKTLGTEQEVKGVAAIAAVPLYLVSNNPDVRSVADFTDKDRIALPAVKVSHQAVLLQMAVAKQFGDKEFAKLDHLTTTMSHPDAVAAMSSGKDVTAHFSAPPYMYAQEKMPGVHVILKSYELLGGPGTTTIVWTTKKFHDQNPKVYKAVLAAFDEAINFINKDHRQAAALYLEALNDKKTSPDEIVMMLDDPQFKFSVTPNKLMPLLDFMNRTGSIKVKADSWKDLFFPEIHSLPGS